MPFKRCGDDGWKWGEAGKCFTGPGARGKALKQARAIFASGGEKSMAEPDLAALAIEALTVSSHEDLLALRAKFHDEPAQVIGLLAGPTTFEEMDAFMGALNRLADARSALWDGETLIENVSRQGGGPAELLAVLDATAARAEAALQAGAPTFAERAETALGERGLSRLVPGFLRRKARSEIQSAFTTEEFSTADAIKSGQAFQLSAKDTKGRTRWLMVAGHNGRDREGEIFPLAGLELNVKAIQETGIYPEAWVAHEPGSRWGLADFVDVLDGVYVASGLVDDNPLAEQVAVRLAEKAEELGVSHAYAVVEQVGDEIRSFFDYEISVLPRARAALPETGALIVGAKEAQMDPMKRTEVEGLLGKDLADGLFAGVDAVNGLVTAAGLDRKQIEPTDAEKALAEAQATVVTAEKAVADEAAAHATPTGTPGESPPPPAPPPAPPTEPTQSAQPPVTNVGTVTTGEKSADELLDERILHVVKSAFGPIAHAIGEMGLGMKQLLETDEAKTAARIKNAAPAFVASKDAGNTQAPGTAEADGPGREPVNAAEQSMADWMTEGIFGDPEKQTEPVTS